VHFSEVHISLFFMFDFEHFSLLECYAVPTGKWLPTFRRQCFSSLELRHLPVDTA
jgi:hypothetical protein